MKTGIWVLVSVQGRLIFLFHVFLEKWAGFFRKAAETGTSAIKTRLSIVSRGTPLISDGIDDIFSAMSQLELDYEFKDLSLLETALTHSSYANEFSCPSNERLEFLGDALLGCVVSVLLYEKYPSYTEGDLSKIRSRIVSGANFAKYAGMLGLGERIRLGKGEEGTGGRARESNNADAFEALIGALYLDAGYEKTFEVVSRLFRDSIEEDDLPPDSKTQLQEVSRRVFGETPEYRILSEEGPPHERTFTAEVRIPSDLTGTGRGGSKRRSEQRAARDALRKLGY